MLSRFVSFLSSYIPALTTGERQPLLSDVKVENKTVLDTLGAFQPLPNEAIQHIATYLTNFIDLHAFALSNKELADIVEPVPTSFHVSEKLDIKGTYGEIKKRINELGPAYRANQKIKRIENTVSFKVGDKLFGTPISEIKSVIAVSCLNLTAGVAAGVTAATAFNVEPIDAFSLGIGTTTGLTVASMCCFSLFNLKNYSQHHTISNEMIKLNSISMQR